MLFFAIITIAFPFTIFISIVIASATGITLQTLFIYLIPVLLLGAVCDHYRTWINGWLKLSSQGGNGIREIICTIQQGLPYVLVLRPYQKEISSYESVPGSGHVQGDGGIVGRDSNFNGPSTHHVPADLMAIMQTIICTVPDEIPIFLPGNPLSSVDHPRLRVFYSPYSKWLTLIPILIENAKEIIFLSPLSGKSIKLELEILDQYKTSDKLSVVCKNENEQEEFCRKYPSLSDRTTIIDPNGYVPEVWRKFLDLDQ